MATIVILAAVPLSGGIAQAATHSSGSPTSSSTGTSPSISCGSLNLSAAADGAAVSTLAVLGGVNAELSGSVAKAAIGPPVLLEPKITVVVRGRRVLQAAVPIPQTAIGSGLVPGGFGRESTPTPWSWVQTTATQPLCVARFGGRAPQTAVLVNEYTGGAHCCTVIDAYPIRPGSMATAPVQDDLGNPDASLVATEGHAVLVTADNAFAYQFASYGGSGMPLLTLELRNGRFVRTTAQHLDWVALDAEFQWGSFVQSQPGYGLGWLAAWAADDCRLGPSSAVWGVLDALDSQGLLSSQLTGWPSGSAYVSQLRSFLSAHGYCGG